MTELRQENGNPVNYDPEESSSNAGVILFRGPEPQKVAELLMLSLIQPSLDVQPQLRTEQQLVHGSSVNLIHPLFLIMNVPWQLEHSISTVEVGSRSTLGTLKSPKVPFQGDQKMNGLHL